jgi:hypothetical protein
MEAFSSKLNRFFKEIFREKDALYYKCEAFLKITRLLEDRHLQRNEGFYKKSEYFSKILKTF